MQMTYDLQTWDLTAVLYAVEREKNFLEILNGEL